MLQKYLFPVSELLSPREIIFQTTTLGKLRQVLDFPHSGCFSLNGRALASSWADTGDTGTFSFGRVSV